MHLINRLAEYDELPVLQVIEHGQFKNIQMTGIKVILEPFPTIIRHAIDNGELLSYKRNASTRLANKDLGPIYNPFEVVMELISINKIDIEEREDSGTDYRWIGFYNKAQICDVLKKMQPEQRQFHKAPERYKDRKADVYKIPDWWGASALKVDKIKERLQIIDTIPPLYVKLYVGTRKPVSREKIEWELSQGIPIDEILDYTAKYTCIVSFHPDRIKRLQIENKLKGK